MPEASQSQVWGLQVYPITLGYCLEPYYGPGAPSTFYVDVSTLCLQASCGRFQPGLFPFSVSASHGGGGGGLPQGQMCPHALRTRLMGKATLVQYHGPPARQERDLDQDQHVFLALGAGAED